MYDTGSPLVQVKNLIKDRNQKEFKVMQISEIVSQWLSKDLNYFYYQIQNNLTITKIDFQQIILELSLNGLINQNKIKYLEDDEISITFKQKKNDDTTYQVYKVVRQNYEQNNNSLFVMNEFKSIFKRNQFEIFQMTQIEYELIKKTFQFEEICNDNISDIRNLKVFKKQFDFSKEDAIQLRELLPHCQKLTSLDLQLKSNNIGQAGTIPLFTNLPYCRNLTRLIINLVNCAIGKEGLRAIVQSLEQPFENLIECRINISGNSIFEFDQVIKLIGQINLCKKLQILELDFSFCSLITETKGQVITFQENSFQNLKQFELNLKCCKIPLSLKFSLINVVSLAIDLSLSKSQPQDVVEVFQSIERSPKIEQLSLNLSYSVINQRSANYIRKALQSLKNLKKIHLDLSQKDCVLSKQNFQNFELISESFCNTNTITFLTLNLKLCCINEIIIRKIADSIKLQENLTSLNLQFMVLQSTDQITDLIVKLPKTIKSLTLSLSIDFIIDLFKIQQICQLISQLERISFLKLAIISNKHNKIRFAQCNSQLLKSLRLVIKK